MLKVQPIPEAVEMGGVMGRTREELDAVTVGQIRELREEQLDSHIDTLTGLIRRRNADEAAKFLEDTIRPRVADLMTLDDWAGLFYIFGDSES